VLLGAGDAAFKRTATAVSGLRPISSDRPDAVLRAPASTLTQLLYQRIGPFTAARRGMLVVGGRVRG
jgi:hypothetical protein